ncbi:hypothetical protein EJB05_01719 [Eragrostis curvula]|uniref:Uncharacterized protein n=1 Tax=Eragrostis curvula TaxID=38414 RepID=A0A5J9WSJ0_9POAL|nr:hypothetical protein EJB05_01719 [Eragrostis curvula]
MWRVPGGDSPELVESSLSSSPAILPSHLPSPSARTHHHSIIEQITGFISHPPQGNVCLFSMQGHGQFARWNRLAMSFPQAFFKAGLILELVVDKQ